MIATDNIVFTMRMIFLTLAITVQSGCVSSTLETSQFRPVGTTSSNAAGSNDEIQTSSEPVSTAPNDLNDPNVLNAAAREQAVQEMRAKGQETSGEKTKIGLLPETATQQLTRSEQNSKAAALKNAAAEAQSSVSDEEIQSKQDSISRLRKKARSHYGDAVKRIEN